MFTGSKIAKILECNRTKTTYILNEALKLAWKSRLIDYMVENPVAFVNDGSSDTNRKKMNAVGGRISFKAPDFSGAQFYLRARSGTQKK